MNLLIPCGGLYKRYPPGMPKYIRPLNDMLPIIVHSLKNVQGLAKNIYFAVRKADEDEWNVSKIIKTYIPANILILKKDTKGPADTIDQMIKHFNIKDKFLIHDCDCSWSPVDTEWNKKQNAISIAWRETAVGDRSSKSWIVFKKDSDEICWIEEKKTPTDWYCCGGYLFSNPQKFSLIYNLLSNQNKENKEIYCSHIIQQMIKDGEIFHGIKCDKLDDWGTWEKYILWKKQKKLYLFDLDGVITEAGGPYGKKPWDIVKPLEGVKEKLKSIKESGGTVYIITARPKSISKQTEEMLNNNGITYDKIIYDLPVGPRILINDYASSNPYPTAQAINSKRNTADWIDMI